MNLYIHMILLNGEEVKLIIPEGECEEDTHEEAQQDLRSSMILGKAFASGNYGHASYRGKSIDYINTNLIVGYDVNSL